MSEETAQPEVETLILRFRDLVTRPGDTIANHQAIIAEKTYVWWGWWSKVRETVPDKVFRALNQKATKGEGLTFLLLDSGSRRLYRAVCQGIDWDSQLERKEAHDEATPPYYRGQRYLAWFKLSKISEAKEGDTLLNGYSYVDIADFFSDGISHYQRFNQKKIYSVRELIQQDRTIWFVRAAREGDLSHEISFFDSEQVEPNDFPTKYRQSGSRNLLWVSDLHFSVDGHHAFPLEPTPGKWPAALAIETALKKEGFADLAGVIVSGDLTWKADPAEYEQAQSFLGWQKQWATLNNFDFLVCPGNHDLPFPQETVQQDLPVTIVTERARSAFAKFYQSFFFKAPNPYLSSGRKFLIGNALAVEIVCFNSSLLEQEEKTFQGHGFIGEAQLADAASQMGWTEEPAGPRPFRIVVLHHHLMPVTYREELVKGRPYSVVLDAEALVRWLVSYRVDLVLHGHMHNPFCARVERPFKVNRPEGPWHRFQVVGLGSTGVKGHQGEVAKNTFGLLRFEDKYLDLKTYTIAPDYPHEQLWSLRIPYGGRES